MKPNRCINIDWLEVFCSESGNNFPHDADYYRRCGYIVREREYGTRQYNQMFTILDNHDESFIEIRRSPVASGSMKTKGIFSPYSCHIRLSNRYCYADNAVSLFSEFLMKHEYTVERLFRIDICMDFEKFDEGDDPNDVMKRYMKGVYTKINQGSIAAHGADRWESRQWQSLSWGAPKSMVSTKFYNKTLELKQAKDKPYIRYAWFVSGLVDDFNALTKVDANGKNYSPTIWRVEFSLRSPARGWIKIEDNNKKHTEVETVPHDLATYATKHNQMMAFAMLAHRYFHFKIYEEGKRKDLCKDKVLFKFNDVESRQVYKLDRLLSEKPKDRSAEALANRLEHYRMMHFDADVRKACDILLKQLQKEQIQNVTPSFNRTEAILLQQLIARRIANPNESFNESVSVLKAMMALEDEIF